MRLMTETTRRSALTICTIATFATFAIAMLCAGTATAQIADSNCYAKSGKVGSKVAKAQGKENAGCVKAAGKGKLTAPLGTCVTADAKGKVAGAKGKVTDLFAAGDTCDGLEGTDLVSSSAAVNAAQGTEALDLLYDIFGDDLNAGQFASTNPGIKCQAGIAKLATKYFEAWEKAWESCKAATVKGGATTAAEVVAACLAETAVNGVGSSLLDAKGKVASAGVKFGDHIQSKCIDEGLDMDTTAPGDCVGGGVQADSVQCLQDLVEARACRAVHTADGFGAEVDCDVVDNGAADASAEAFCNPLNNVDCAYPYPSNYWTVADSSRPTGLRVQLPPQAMFPVNGDPVSPEPLNELDGFSTGSQILMHLETQVDLEQTNAGRLLAPGCCGQPAGPPWIDTRTYTARSTDSDSPSILMEADTGVRILHWLELDARATGDQVPGRQSLVVRPGVILQPNTRYIVALRNLKGPGGVDVDAEASFGALRDNTVTSDPGVEAVRARMEADVFAPLTANGIDRSSLDLAFDFTTASLEQQTGQMLSMRDQSFAWLATVDADPGQIPFTVDSETIVNDCSDPSHVVWKEISGTFQAPLFLDGLPEQSGVQFMNVDANDVPVQNGFMDSPYDISIPCSIFDGGVTTRPIVLGHGIFGTGQGMVQGIPLLKSQFGDEWTYIAGGTDWIGLSSRRDTSSDVNWIGQYITGINISQLNNFPAFTDRLRQGVLNQLVLGKMMKTGLFCRDTAFEHAPGECAFPGAGEEMFYYGISLGGIHGTYFMGLSPDVERGVLDVPAVNFSCLLQRSTQFLAFEIVLGTVGVTDPLDYIKMISLLEELWGAAEPVSTVHNTTTDPLPGSGSAKKLLYWPAWLDKQVSNQCTEAAVRSLGIPNLTGSLVEGLVDIPDVTGPVDSASVMWDTGSFNIFDPAQEPEIPPLSNQIPTNVCDPHNGPRQTPAATTQMLTFLQPGGQISNFCDGTCDSVGALETPGGGTCDALSPVELQGIACGTDARCGGGSCVAVAICDPLAP